MGDLHHSFQSELKESHPRVRGLKSQREQRSPGEQLNCKSSMQDSLSVSCEVSIDLVLEVHYQYKLIWCSFHICTCLHRLTIGKHLRMSRCDARSGSSKQLLQEENDYGVSVPRGVGEETPRILLSSSRDLCCCLTCDILCRMYLSVGKQWFSGA